jgi:hypothetical protein
MLVDHRSARRSPWSEREQIRKKWRSSSACCVATPRSVLKLVVETSILECEFTTSPCCPSCSWQDRVPSSKTSVNIWRGKLVHLANVIDPLFIEQAYLTYAASSLSQSAEEGPPHQRLISKINPNIPLHSYWDLGLPCQGIRGQVRAYGLYVRDVQAFVTERRCPQPCVAGSSRRSVADSNLLLMLDGPQSQSRYQAIDQIKGCSPVV